MEGKPALSSPGEDAVESYVHGGCHLIALALNEVFGLPLRGMWDECASDVPAGFMGLLHFYAILPDGRAADARGIRSEDEIAAEFGFAMNDVVLLDHSPQEVRAHQEVNRSDVAGAVEFIITSQFVEELSGVVLPCRPG